MITLLILGKRWKTLKQRHLRKLRNPLQKAANHLKKLVLLEASDFRKQQVSAPEQTCFWRS